MKLANWRLTLNVPTGTVTFLFTDIEGSTKLWEQHPDTMPTVLAQHDALLRKIIGDNSGYVFKTIGDAFCAAFATASNSLTAALNIQRALIHEFDEAELTLRVRMALHTGTAEYRDDDYFGQPLNRVARLLSAGHGGQVLLSDVAYNLTRDLLPPSTELKSMGEHRLKDLGRPEHVYQLLHPTLLSEFPPLKTLDNPDLPNNLPQQVTSFIGREKDIEGVKSLLDKTRLLMLTGSGGCGKTRLSLQVAAEVLENFPDGVWLVELAPLSDPALVPQAVASVLGLREATDKPILQTLVDYLKGSRLLLLLDNCEHVLDACAHLASVLLKNCPQVRLLASSREAMGIAGEQTYRIPSLSLPDTRQKHTAESVSQFEAVRLFIERALSVHSQFEITNANAPALAQLCARLDGIPLAIELSAARVRSLSVEEINARLDNRFRLLTGGNKMALPRQQTLRALIDWSYDLLNASEKKLLCRLSAFAGGWTLEAAEAVGVGDEVEDWEVIDLLTSLIDKSLIVSEQDQGKTRYRLLETIRQYAGDRLEENGEVTTVRERHQAFFVALAEEGEPHLVGAKQAEWLNRLEREHDNMRTALNWDNRAGALQIAGAFWRFWDIRGYLSEGCEVLTGVLAEPSAQAHTSERAKALRGAGTLSRSQGDYPAARTLHGECLAVYQELNNQQGVAIALNNLGLVAQNQGNYAEAGTLYQESLAIHRSLNNKLGIAHTLHNLGEVTYEQGEYAAARLLHEESLTLLRALRDLQSIAWSLHSLGMVAFCQRDYATARKLQEESLTLRYELVNKRGIAFSLEMFATFASVQEQSVRATILWAAATTLREEVGAPLPFGDRPDHDRQVRQVHAKLGEETFAAAWSEGCAMTLKQSVEYALEKAGAASVKAFETRLVNVC